MFTVMSARGTRGHDATRRRVPRPDDSTRLGALAGPAGGHYTRATVQFRHIAIEGPIGVGKSALAERLGTRLDATLVLEDTENPFLADFYAGPARRRAAGAALLPARTATASRAALRQADLFSQITICDYLFDKDKIYAYLNLDDNELFIYQRLYDLLARDVPPPDLVIYLQAPTDVLARRLRDAPAAGGRRRSDARRPATCRS